MATIIDTPNATVEKTVVERTDNGGWVVAVVILIAVLVVGGFAWMYYHPAMAPAPAVPATSNGGTNINVTVPPSSDNSGAQSGDTSGNASGAAGSASASAPPATQQ